MTYYPRQQWATSTPKWTALNTPTAEAWQHHSGYGKPPTGDPVQFMREFEAGEMRRDPDLIAAAYHRLVISGGPHDGDVFEIRPFGKMGGATRTHNSISHAICIYGDFTKDHPSELAIDAAAGQWADAIRGGFLAAGAVIEPHSRASGNATACCGTYLIDKLPIMREAVQAKLRMRPIQPPPPPGPTHPSATPPTIRRGSHGDLVRLWQGMLNATTGAGLKQDGDFGSQTQQKTINFQKVWGLPADGIVGPNTWNHMTLSLALKK